jgi:hypothetical protein
MFRREGNAGSRSSFAWLAQSARREAARAREPGLVLQIIIDPAKYLAWRGLMRLGFPHILAPPLFPPVFPRDPGEGSDLH